MEPKIWGPPAWHFLHTITFNYPEKPSYKDKSNYYDFFHNLQFVLPCEVCQANYQKHLKEYPISPYLDSKKALVEWLVHIHNLVNQENNKPLMSSEDVIRKYKSQYMSGRPFCHDYHQSIKENKPEKKKKNKLQIILISLLGLLIFLMIVFLIQKNYKLNLKIKKLNII
tara:strand:+ start:66 stop:572 length:507 start_codon:yes stop_codon:yes gene_type:complete